MLPVESVLDEILLRVQVVQDLIRVAGVAGSKDHNFILILQTPQQLHRTWPNVDACLRLLSSRKLNRDFEIVLELDALVAVDEGLI